MQLSGTILDYFLCYGAGVAVSFTPCLYPVLPVTASFIAGINTDGSRRRGFILSLLYVLGIAIVYCVLAVVAALSGRFFGQIQNSPFVLLFVSLCLGYFALVMFDVARIPSFGLHIQNKIKGRNALTVILFGIVSGLMIGPCTAPVLGSLLFYVASKQNMLHSVTLMFVFAYGVGTSLILVGTFSGLLSSLPKSGKWMVRIKQLCGSILLIVSLYFLVHFTLRIL